eukprot:PhM_4_TR776/c0_g1_i1/m.91300
MIHRRNYSALFAVLFVFVGFVAADVTRATPNSPTPKTPDISEDRELFHEAIAKYTAALESERSAAVAHRTSREALNDKSTARSADELARLKTDLERAEGALRSAQNRRKAVEFLLNRARRSLGVESIEFTEEQFDIWVTRPQQIVSNVHRAAESHYHNLGPLVGTISALMFVLFTAGVAVVLFPLLIGTTAHMSVSVLIAYSPRVAAMTNLLLWVGIPALVLMPLWYYLVAWKFFKLLVS